MCRAKLKVTCAGCVLLITAGFSLCAVRIERDSGSDYALCAVMRIVDFRARGSTEEPTERDTRAKLFQTLTSRICN